MLLGSRYFPYNDNEKYILFLEDHEKFSGIGEVSSYLSHIEQSEFIKNVTGLIFGHYSTTIYHELLERLKRFGQKHTVPVMHCDDFGHGVNHGILPIGWDAELDADACTLRFF